MAVKWQQYKNNWIIVSSIETESDKTNLYLSGNDEERTAGSGRQSALLGSRVLNRLAPRAPAVLLQTCEQRQTIQHTYTSHDILSSTHQLPSQHVRHQMCQTHVSIVKTTGIEHLHHKENKIHYLLLHRYFNFIVILWKINTWWQIITEINWLFTLELSML